MVRASPTAEPEVASLTPARSHTFVEIDHEIISMVNLLLPLSRRVVVKQKYVHEVLLNLTADPGVPSSIPARSLSFVEIDHEIISIVILLHPLSRPVVSHKEKYVHEYCLTP